LDLGARISTTRQEAGISQQELADKLCVDISTIRNWEGNRRQLSLDKLIRVAEELRVSVIFLLGVDERLGFLEPIDLDRLPILHATPVWTASRGWALVNTIDRTLVFSNMAAVPIDDVQEPLFAIPPAFAISLRGIGAPLDIDGVLSRERIWVEPITSDTELAAELRGWFQPRGRKLVENEFGNRFYINTYGAKWLAFESCLE